MLIGHVVRTPYRQAAARLVSPSIPVRSSIISLVAFAGHVPRLTKCQMISPNFSTRPRSQRLS